MKSTPLWNRPRPRRWIALASAVSILVLVFGYQVFALTGSTFEATDGNLVAGSGTDWDTAPGRRIGIDLATGSGDDSFGMGTSENTPVPSIVDGQIPNNKADLTRFYVANEKVAASDFLYLAWERVQEPTGTTNVSFEFNQSSTLSSNGVTYVRTAGDLLVDYGITNGGTQVGITRRLWTATEWGPALDLTGNGTAEGSFNNASVVDPIAPDAPRTLSVRTFGEAAINLTASGLFPAGQCVSFGSAFVKSGSSDQLTSSLKDFIAPIPVRVTNCGTIVVHKNAVPDDGADFGFTLSGTGSQSFTLDDDGNDTNGTSSTITITNLQPGSYAVTEAATQGWDLTGLACTATGGGSGSQSQTDALRADITVVGGGTVDCTFTNTRQQAYVNVVKHVVNDDGGTAVAGDFTISVNDPGSDPSPVAGNEQGTLVPVDPGSYSVSESGTAPGYAVSYSGDCQSSVAAGETKTCTVTNNDIRPTLTVVKHVVNDNGGTASADDFTMTVDAAGAAPASSPGNEGGTAVSLAAGSYNVTETGPDGYAGTFSAGCSGVIGVGESRTCTVTNNDAAPGLTVVKHVVNDNGGTKTAADFTIHVSGTAVDPGTFQGSEGGTTVALHAGSYTVTEDRTAGYAASYSDDCTGSVALGQTKVCTITNDDIQPRLTVVKHVVNDDGGTADAGDFTMAVDGPNAAPASFPGNEQGSPVDLDAGAYSVSESGPQGYAATMSADCAGTMAVGDVRTCTVTNDDQAPGLTVVKHVVNDDGGTLAADDFTIHVSGTGVSPLAFDGSEQGTEVSLEAGAYEVTEDEAPGYAATLSADCKGTIALGQTKTCTITNDDIQPKLVVKKIVVNDDGGTMTSGDFTMNVSGTTTASFAGSPAGTEVALDAGQYAVDETAVPGYAKSLSTDCSGTIAIGQTKTCTVTNNDIRPTLTVIKHVVNDNGGTASAGDFTMKVDGGSAAPASSPGDEEGTTVALDAGSYNVTETGPAGYVGTFSADCEGIIGVGEHRTCTVTIDDAAPGLTIVKHVVNDNGGTKTAADFTIHVSGTAVDPADFKGSEDGTTVALHAGSYAVTEERASGYAASFSDDCTGTVALGEAKVCTITNDDVQPRLTVRKHVVNDSGAQKTAGQFTMLVTGTVLASFPGSETGTTIGLNAGQYAVDEVADAGYAKSLGAGCAGTIAVGEEKTCTVTNDDIVEVLGVLLEPEVLPAQLPRTGGSWALLVGVAVALLGAGGLALAEARRRTSRA
ncbi:MAG: prealbumin-like fold domain-containing protein [Actinomycetota bacterium]